MPASNTSKIGSNLQSVLDGITAAPIIIKYANGTTQQSRFLSILRGSAFGTIRSIPRFRMIGTIVSRDDIGSIADDPNVERMFLDKRNQIPEIPFPIMLTGMANGGIANFIRDRTAAPGSRIANIKGQGVVTTEDTRNLLGVPAAESMGINGSGVNLAIVDTGMSPRYFTHPQMRRRITYKTPEGIPQDTNGHCTWLMSCIFGKKYTIPIGGSNITVEGLAHGVSPIVAKGLFTPEGMAPDSVIIKALDAAIDLKADVFNLSLGSSASSTGAPATPEDDALVQVIESQPDTTIFAIAAGNDGAPELSSPADAENAISVGALDPRNMQVASFSNAGCDFAGPGVNILSGIQSGTFLDAVGKVTPGFAVLSGTSMATPHIASLIALAKQYGRQKGVELTWQDIINIGQQYGTPKNAGVGYGLLTWPMVQSYLK
jgi:subtilisin family serine protease